MIRKMIRIRRDRGADGISVRSSSRFSARSTRVSSRSRTRRSDVALRYGPGQLLPAGPSVFWRRGRAFLGRPRTFPEAGAFLRDREFFGRGREFLGRAFLGPSVFPGTGAFLRGPGVFGGRPSFFGETENFSGGRAFLRDREFPRTGLFGFRRFSEPGTCLADRRIDSTVRRR